MCVCMYVGTNVCMHVCMYSYMHVLCIYVCMYALFCVNSSLPSCFYMW